MSKIVLLSAGHSNSDPGAVNGTIREADIAIDMRKMVAHYLRKWNVVVRTDGNNDDNRPLREAIKLIAGTGLAVEFHCNAATNKSAGGVEALARPEHREISQELCGAIHRTMGIKPRGDAGYKPENAGQHSRLAFVSNGGIILELFFISNDSELATWHKKKWLVAKEVAAVIEEFINA